MKRNIFLLLYLLVSAPFFAEDYLGSPDFIAQRGFGKSEAEARQITTEINRIENVWQATFVSREEALEQFIKDHSDTDALAGIDATVLRHRIVVSLEDNSQMETTVRLIELIPGVAKISAAYELAAGFNAMQDVLEIVSVGVIAVLLIVSLLIISNTVKIAMYDRRDEIAIMKMVGATNGFIRTPFVVEGFILGMTGAGIAFALQWALYDALLVRIAAVDVLQMFKLVPFEQLLLPMAIVFGAAGMFVGILGSHTSIRKFLNV